MSYRLAKAKATLEATRISIAARSTYRRPSYAEVASCKLDKVKAGTVFPNAAFTPGSYHQRHNINEDSLGRSSHSTTQTGSVRNININSLQKEEPLSNDLNGWTEVRRKKPYTRKPVKPTHFLTRHQQDLQTNNKCFKCFAKGHKKSLCKENIRCLKCKIEGHIARFCQGKKPANSINWGINANAKGKEVIQLAETINKDSPSSSSDIQTTSLNPPEKQPTMDPYRNWQNMLLSNPHHIESGRAEELSVFIPQREELLPANMFLERTAVVMTGPHQFDQTLAHRLSAQLANHFRGHPRDFIVTKTHPNTGDCIAIFPNTPMRDEAVLAGVFSLGPLIEVQLTAWTNEVGFIYDPAPCVARIRLHGVPLQHWNDQDVATLVSGFGELERVAPFFEDGNYEYISLLIECRHPVNVPRNLLASTGKHSVRIQVVLDGWAYVSDLGELPPVRGPRGRIDTLHQGGNTAARSQQSGATHATRQSISSQIHRALLPANRWRRRQAPEWRPVINKLESPILAATGDVQKIDVTKTGVQIILLSKGLENSLSKAKGDKKDVNGRETGDRRVVISQISFEVTAIKVTVCATIQCNGPLRKMYGQFSVCDPSRAVRGFGVMSFKPLTDFLTGFLSSQPATKNRSTVPSDFQTPSTGWVSKTRPSTWAQQQSANSNRAQLEQAEQRWVGLEECITSLPPSAAVLIHATGNQNKAQLEQCNTPQNEEQGGDFSNSAAIEEGPPPGFPNTITATVPRRSQRLHSKRSGHYISPEERARMVTKPYSVPIAKRTAMKRARMTPIKLDYMKSFDPLTENQAEAVIMAAGVDIAAVPQAQTREVLVIQ